MIIRTPSDLATYLISIATQHRAVQHVVYGEHSRSESDTLAASQYPQVDIETPMAQIPVEQSQARLTTRLYVISSTPGGLNADEDIVHDVTFKIARDLVNLIIKHTGTGFLDIELSSTEIKITPVVAMGSDQQRGWMFSLEFMIDNDQCADDDDDATLVIPQFEWSIPGGSLLIRDLTHGNAYDDVQLTWYRQTSLHPSAAVLDIQSEVILVPAEDSSWYAHLWLRAVVGTHTLWAYAYVTRSQKSGRSTSFVPSHPV